jgi:hypothetical protein
MQGEWGGQAAAAWAPRPDLLWHSFPQTPNVPAVAAPPMSAPIQAAQLSASWNGHIHIFLVPYTVALPLRSPARAGSAAGGPSGEAPSTPDQTVSGDMDASSAADGQAGAAAASQPDARPASLHLRPVCTRAIALEPGEVAAQLGWMATGGSDAAGSYKLVVLAVPALSEEATATGSRSGEHGTHFRCTVEITRPCSAIPSLAQLCPVCALIAS